MSPWHLRPCRRLQLLLGCDGGGGGGCRGLRRRSLVTTERALVRTPLQDEMARLVAASAEASVSHRRLVRKVDAHKEESHVVGRHSPLACPGQLCECDRKLPKLGRGSQPDDWKAAPIQRSHLDS